MEPQIRINDLVSEWQTKKLGELSTSFSGGTPTAGVARYYGGKIPFIRSGEINENRTQLFLTEEGLKVSSAKMVEKGTILYALYGATSGEVGIAKIKGAINQAILAIIPTDNINTEYLAHYLKAKKNTIVGTLLQGGQGNLSGALVKDFPICFPSMQGQTAIANYFNSVDALVSAYSQKIESLKQLKAASLISMFPQHGESKPRLRFKGFEGEWGAVLFGSLITECFEKSTTEDEDILLSSAINGMFLNSELFGHQRGRSNIGYRKLRKNMLVLSAQNLHLGNANVNLRFEHGLVSPAYKIYDIHNVAPEFMAHWIKREETKKFFLNATTAGASLCRKNIIWNDLYKQTLYIPKSEAEQCQIADFFTALDRRITLETQRLEKLKQIKSACLDKMFV